MRGDAQGGLSSFGFHKLSRRCRIFLESWKRVLAFGSLGESTWCWLISEEYDLGRKDGALKKDKDWCRLAARSGPIDKVSFIFWRLTNSQFLLVPRTISESSERQPEDIETDIMIVD